MKVLIQPLQSALIKEAHERILRAQRDLAFLIQGVLGAHNIRDYKSAELNDDDSMTVDGEPQA
jgi:hypothetical protein